MPESSTLLYSNIPTRSFSCSSTNAFAWQSSPESKVSLDLLRVCFLHFWMLFYHRNPLNQRSDTLINILYWDYNFSLSFLNFPNSFLVLSDIVEFFRLWTCSKIVCKRCSISSSNTADFEFDSSAHLFQQIVVWKISPRCLFVLKLLHFLYPCWSPKCNIPT